MRRFDVTILMATCRIGCLGLHAIMSQQRPVLGRESLRLPFVMDRQTHPVRAVTLGHRPQRPPCILQARAQAGEALAETERDMLLLTGAQRTSSFLKL